MITPRAPLALTATAVEKLKPAAARREVPDRDGLFLVVQPSGAKSWAFRYRSPVDGKPRKLTIGPYPAFGLGDAREAAHEARKLAQRSVDPVEAAKAARAKARDRSNIVTDLIDDYLKKYDAEHKASSTAEIRRLFDKWVKPAIGAKRVEDVKRRDIEAILAAMTRAGAPISANRLLAALKPFFTWVRVDGEPLSLRPTDGVDRPASEEGRDRDRVLTDAEIRWLWRATDDATPFSAAVRVMLLTGQRRGEVAGMTLPELDLEAKTWLLPAARTKNGRENLVPLSAPVAAAIGRPARIGRSKLVFTSTSGTELSGWSKCKAALDARMLTIATEVTGRPPNIEPWTLHDLRRSCATGMARLGEQPHIIEAVLNHKTGQITRLAGIYNRHAYETEKRQALERWATHVEGLAHA
jgi:integrase